MRKSGPHLFGPPAERFATPDNVEIPARPGMPRLPPEPRGERRFADPTGYGNKENRPGRAPSADVYADFPHGVARKQQERSFHQSRVFVGVKRVPQPNYG